MSPFFSEKFSKCISFWVGEMELKWFLGLLAAAKITSSSVDKRGNALSLDKTRGTNHWKLTFATSWIAYPKGMVKLAISKGPIGILCRCFSAGQVFDTNPKNRKGDRLKNYHKNKRSHLFSCLVYLAGTSCAASASSWPIFDNKPTFFSKDHGKNGTEHFAK